MSQVFWTILTGVSVFILGQALQNFVLKPIQDLIRVLGEISHKVKFHSNILLSSGISEEKVRWATGDMRDLSCQLESRYVVIPLKGIFEFFDVIPERKAVSRAAEDLILLSNAGGNIKFVDENLKAIEDIKKILKIDL